MKNEHLRSEEVLQKIEWSILQHVETNHKYDGDLPYRFHLEMVANFADNYMHLIKEQRDLVYHIYVAAYAHDTIEDCRVTYNDVKSALGYAVAEIVYALTNEKGKNRKERANLAYYEGIKKTPGAVFVKLCDRLANVAYSRMTGSKMLGVYRKENQDFQKMLSRQEHPTLEPMFQKLDELLEP